ncbi:MAG: Gldg family protein [Chloroflexi bacterium]|nr:Gldg family protein [Chloroflexota bacterium]
MTTNPETPVNPENEPFIPPNILLGLAALGLTVALFVRLTQPQFGVIGWGTLAFTVLALAAWAVLAPEQAREFMRGRALRFGGVSVFVTVLVLAVLVVSYGFIKDRGWRADLTESEEFTLTEDARAAMRVVANDPNVPPMRILAFYGGDQADRRDQDTVLFEDYIEAATSDAGVAKLSYQFVDPDRNPTQVELYGVLPGQLVVVEINPDGTENIENKQVVDPNAAQFGGPDFQTSLTNAILRVGASGDFRAYFLSVQDGLELDDEGDEGLSIIRDSLVDRFGWNVQQLTAVQLSGPQSTVTLNDPAADGEVLIVPGGSEALRDSDLQTIIDYVDAGGNLIIFADLGAENDGESLATAENMGRWLWDAFGVRFSQEVVLDQSLSLQTPIQPASVEFSDSNYITASFGGQDAVVFFAPHALEIADTLPTNVSVTELAFSSDQAYSKTLEELLNEEINPTDSDPTGRFVLALVAENSATGARVVLFGSTNLASNGWAQASSLGVRNIDMAFNAIVWVTGFNDFFVEQIPRVEESFDPQDAPFAATQQEIRNINVLTLLVLPFGVLLIGVLVWWFSRERAQPA